jgi:hypothetical protein
MHQLERKVPFVKNLLKILILISEPQNRFLLLIRLSQEKNSTINNEKKKWKRKGNRRERKRGLGVGAEQETIFKEQTSNKQ